MIDERSIQDETEAEVKAYQEKPVEDQEAETDPFFATGHFSIHHQPERDENEFFMGE
jgi:hypothetical protein